MPLKSKTKLTFEDCYIEIEKIVEKFRYKWTLSSIAWLSFEDLKWSIISHVHKKWNLFDQKQGLGGWVATITKNQLTNWGRNLFTNYSKPCNSCVCSENTENYCRVFGSQDSSVCPILKKWEKSKKEKYNISLPLALEYHSNE